MDRSTGRPPRIFTAIRMALAGAVFALAALVAASDARAQLQEPKITVVGEGPVSVKATTDDDTAKSAMIVVNEGPASVRIASISFEASSWTPPGAKSPVARTAGIGVENTFVPKTLVAGATRLVVTLNGLAQLTGDPIEGQLILHGENKRVLVAKSVSITPAPQPSANWPRVFFVAGIVLLVVLGLLSLWSLAAARPSGTSLWSALESSAPGPDWTVDGWSGRLAAVGGLLAIVLGEITLPSAPREISKETLVQMNVVFVSLLAVGPFIFYALRRNDVRGEWDHKVPFDKMEEKGVWGLKAFLLSSYVITAVAVVGQVAALTLLGCEITDGTGWHVVVIVIGVCLAALALRSFFVVTRGQARTDWDAKATAEEPETPVTVKQPIQVYTVDPPAAGSRS